MIDLDLVEFEDIVSKMILSKAEEVYDGDTPCSKEIVREYLSFALSEFFTKAVCTKFPNFIHIPEFEDWFSNQPGSTVRYNDQDIRVFTVDDMTPTLKFCFIMAIDSVLDDLIEHKVLRLRLDNLDMNIQKVQPVELDWSLSK